MGHPSYTLGVKHCTMESPENTRRKPRHRPPTLEEDERETRKKGRVCVLFCLLPIRGLIEHFCDLRSRRWGLESSRERSASLSTLTKSDRHRYWCDENTEESVGKQDHLEGKKAGLFPALLGLLLMAEGDRLLELAWVGLELHPAPGCPAKGQVGAEILLGSPHSAVCPWGSGLTVGTRFSTLHKGTRWASICHAGETGQILPILQKKKHTKVRTMKVSDLPKVTQLGNDRAGI